MPDTENVEPSINSNNQNIRVAYPNRDEASSVRFSLTNSQYNSEISASETSSQVPSDIEDVDEDMWKSLGLPMDEFDQVKNARAKKVAETEEANVANDDEKRAEDVEFVDTPTESFSKVEESSEAPADLVDSQLPEVLTITNGEQQLNAEKSEPIADEEVHEQIEEDIEEAIEENVESGIIVDIIPPTPTHIASPNIRTPNTASTDSLVRTMSVQEKLAEIRQQIDQKEKEYSEMMNKLADHERIQIISKSKGELKRTLYSVPEDTLTSREQLVAELTSETEALVQQLNDEIKKRCDIEQEANRLRSMVEQVNKEVRNSQEKERSNRQQYESLFVEYDDLKHEFAKLKEENTNFKRMLDKNKTLAEENEQQIVDLESKVDELSDCLEQSEIETKKMKRVVEVLEAEKKVLQEELDLERRRSVSKLSSSANDIDKNYQLVVAEMELSQAQLEETKVLVERITQDLNNTKEELDGKAHLLVQFQKDLKEAESEKNEAQKVIVEIQNDLAEIKLKYSGEKSFRVELEKKLQELELKAENESEILRKADNELQHLRNELSKEREDKKILQVQNDSLRQQVANSSSSGADESEPTPEELRQVVERITAQLSESQRELAAAKSQLDFEKQLLENAQSDLEHSKYALAQEKEEMKKILEQVSILQQQVANDAKDLEAEKSISNEFRSTAEELSTQLSASKQDQINVQNLLQKEHQQLKTLESELERYKNILRTEQEDKEKMREQNLLLQQQISTTSDNIETEKSASEQLRLLVEKLQIQLSKSQQELIELQAQYENEKLQRLEAEKRILDANEKSASIKKTKAEISQKARENFDVYARKYLTKLKECYVKTAFGLAEKRNSLYSGPGDEQEIFLFVSELQKIYDNLAKEFQNFEELKILSPEGEEEQKNSQTLRDFIKSLYEILNNTLLASMSMKCESIGSDIITKLQHLKTKHNTLLAQANIQVENLEAKKNILTQQVDQLQIALQQKEVHDIQAREKIERINLCEKENTKTFDLILQKLDILHEKYGVLEKVVDKLGNQPRDSEGLLKITLTSMETLRTMHEQVLSKFDGFVQSRKVGFDHNINTDSTPQTSRENNPPSNPENENRAPRYYMSSNVKGTPYISYRRRTNIISSEEAKCDLLRRSILRKISEIKMLSDY